MIKDLLYFVVLLERMDNDSEIIELDPLELSLDLEEEESPEIKVERILQEQKEQVEEALREAEEIRQDRKRRFGDPIEEARRDQKRRLEQKEKEIASEQAEKRSRLGPPIWTFDKKVSEFIIPAKEKTRITIILKRKNVFLSRVNLGLQK